MNHNTKSFIAGNWVDTFGESFDSYNPVNQQAQGTYYSAGDKEIEQATTAALEAYQIIRQFSGKKMAAVLNTMADEIEALGDELLETADSETGLGLVRLTGERGRTTNQIRAFAKVISEGSWLRASIDTALPERTPPKPDIRRMLRPIGPVLVFPASNFPFAFGLLGGDTASALAAGNPVILKAHPAHPATSVLLALAMEKTIVKCELPAGIFSMLQGSDITLAQNLVAHPSIEAIGFTGSLNAGRAIMDTAAKRPIPIPVYAEMGSTNPVFLTPAALEDRGEIIAEQLADSMCMGTGQFCTSPGVIIGLENEAFVNALASRLQSNPNGTLLHPSIAATLARSLKNAQANSDLQLITGGSAEGNTATLTPENSLYLTSASAFIESPALQHEIFGPAAIYVACDNEAQMLAVARAMDGNLTATIHCTETTALVRDLMTIVEQSAGRILFNGYPTGVEVCPSQQHGGPYPACSVASSTSVGDDSISRYVRFVAYQNAPEDILPEAVQAANPLNIQRLVNGEFSREALS